MELKRLLDQQIQEAAARAEELKAMFDMVGGERVWFANVAQSGGSNKYQSCH